MISSAPTTRAKAHQQQQLLNELTSEISKKGFTILINFVTLIFMLDSSPETGKDEPESADASDLINKRIPMAAEERQGS